MKGEDIAKFIKRMILEIGQSGSSVVIVDLQNIRSYFGMNTTCCQTLGILL
jgi:hypothetical protein